MRALFHVRRDGLGHFPERRNIEPFGDLYLPSCVFLNELDAIENDAIGNPCSEYRSSALFPLFPRIEIDAAMMFFSFFYYLLDLKRQPDLCISDRRSVLSQVPAAA